MPNHDLHISKRLKALLPPLTAEEKKQLEANLVEDGRVIDPILYWHDGKKDVVVDGMNRYPLAEKHGLSYGVERVLSDAVSYEEVEEWIWNHQAGRRNLTREAIGTWYNQTKTGRGGDRKTKGAKSTLIDAAEHIAEKTGKNVDTVKRAGKRVETLEQCAPAVQKAVGTGAIKVSDADLKTLSKLPQGDQATVATAIRKGRAKTVREAMKIEEIKAPSKLDKNAAYRKCPNCAGTKWAEDQDGFSCVKCHHPHGEPAGDVDEDRIKTQRQKTVKTVEALLRAFDDLQTMRARPEHSEAIKTCKGLLKTAKNWK